MKRKLQALRIAFICTFLFTAVSGAQEEPKTKPENEAKPERNFTLQRPSKPQGKWRTTQKFSTPSFLRETANSCWGVCDCGSCYCESDEGIGCCLDGCNACWEFLDGGGECEL